MQGLTGRIEDWTVIHYGDDKYSISGKIFNDIHERWPDGTVITTSGIKEGDFPRGNLKPEVIVDTRNSTYILGNERD